MSVKLALCIKKREAPLAVQSILAGTYLLPITEEFFATPTQLEDRATCETDETLLQLLPYIMLVDERGYVFRYFRGAAGNEARLHGRVSVGVGGHVDDYPLTMNLFDYLKVEASREIGEEVGMLVHPSSIQFERLIYNPEGVNAVHLGILGILRVDSAVTKMALEAGVIENGEFVDPRDLVQLVGDVNYGRLEPWSQAAVWHLLNVNDFSDAELGRVGRHFQYEVKPESVDYHPV